MKQSPLPKVLLAALAVVAIFSGYRYMCTVRNSTELRDYQMKLNVINQRNAVLNALAGDLIEYSKKHPAIDSVLESVGIKQGKNTPASAPVQAPASITAPSIRTPGK